MQRRSLPDFVGMTFESSLFPLTMPTRHASLSVGGVGWAHVRVSLSGQLSVSTLPLLRTLYHNHDPADTGLGFFNLNDDHDISRNCY
jgi:hypothetical protein